MAIIQRIRRSGAGLSMRAISRPSQLAFGVGLLAVAWAAITYAVLTGLTPLVRRRALGLWDSSLVNLAFGLVTRRV